MNFEGFQSNDGQAPVEAVEKQGEDDVIELDPTELVGPLNERLSLTTEQAQEFIDSLNDDDVRLLIMKNDTPELLTDADNTRLQELSSRIRHN